MSPEIRITRMVDCNDGVEARVEVLVDGVRFELVVWNGYSGKGLELWRLGPDLEKPYSGSKQLYGADDFV